MTSLEQVVQFSRVPTNGIELHVAEAGPRDGPLVILLHGFPEFWYCWRNQIPTLAEQGFHVIAPDQRGYNLSDKPSGVDNYRLDRLAADIVGLAERLGHDTFSVVGHDWGSSIGWWLAEKYEGHVNRLAVLNAPHPAVWVHAMRHNPAQSRRSRYVRILQLPWLPEFMLSLGNYSALAKSLQQSVRKGAFTEEEIGHYRDAWRQPGALTSMIHWYRALLRQPPEHEPERRISCPVLVIWGKRDEYAEPAMAEESARLCLHSRIAWLQEATHWVQHDEPEQVASLLVDFLRPPIPPD